MRYLLRAFVVLALAARGFAQFSVEIAVTDSGNLPISGARVELRIGRRLVQAGDTNALGKIQFGDTPPGDYQLVIQREGFEKYDARAQVSRSDTLAVVMTIAARADSVEVRGAVMEVEEATAKPNTLPPDKAKELPNRPATVADVLPLTPGVLREPGGALILSASAENRSAMIVNSADVTDPATGGFGLTVPIDSVEVVSVYQTAYLAEYGRFTAALVSVETRRGGEKWKWELNDPLPEFRIRSWHLRGLRTATPRINFQGPILPKLFISQGIEYEVRKTAIYTLPFPYNQKKLQGINSFTQLDWVQSDRHWLTATMHDAPQRLGALTLDYFNPLPTTPDARARNLTGTVTDRLSIWHGLLENRFSLTDFDGATWGKGNDPLRIGPFGNTGSFFADQRRTARRISGDSSFAFAPFIRRGLGSQQFKIGVYLARSDHSGDLVERPIHVVDAQKRLLMSIEFPRTREFSVDDLEKSSFVQDHWILTPRLAVDIGARSESQQISGSLRVAPRAGISWTPSTRARTILRGGAGYFYDRVPLNVYAFNRYPGRVITEYDTAGNIISGPTLFLNTLGQNRVRRPFVSQSPQDGNFSPRSLVWSMQVEQPVTRWLKMRATYLTNRSDGLVIMRQLLPEPGAEQGAYLLDGSGTSNYRQFDLIAQVHLRDDRELFFSYTHSKARGDINDFSRFLGVAPSPVIRHNQYGILPTNMLNRFIAWGVVRLPAKFQIAPVIEYRNGFPYLETDAAQGYAGTPYRNQFPHFFSLDSRFSKDLKLNADYSVRLSLSSFNLTNHFNPEQVHGNTADPAYGYFFGHRGRRFTMDFDFLF